MIVVLQPTTKKSMGDSAHSLLYLWALSHCWRSSSSSFFFFLGQCTIDINWTVMSSTVMLLVFYNDLHMTSVWRNSCASVPVRLKQFKSWKKKKKKKNSLFGKQQYVLFDTWRLTMRFQGSIVRTVSVACQFVEEKKKTQQGSAVDLTRGVNCCSSLGHWFFRLRPLPVCEHYPRARPRACVFVCVCARAYVFVFCNNRCCKQLFLSYLIHIGRVISCVLISLPNFSQ